MQGPTTRLRLIAATLCLLGLTACGPKQSVSLGVQDVTTDILLTGNHPTPAPTLPPAPPPPGFPFVPTPVQPTGDGNHIPLPPPPIDEPPAPPAACPQAPVYANPTTAAPNRPTAPPKEGSYTTRVDGSFSLSGTSTANGSYGPAGARKVSNVGTLAGGVGWVYDITDEAGLVTSYEVVPQQVGQQTQPVENPNQQVPTQPGIYVTAFTYIRADKSALALTPQPPLMVAKLPFTAGDRWTAHSTDASRGVAITLNGQTGLNKDFKPVKDRVDACGTPLDAWWVEYTVDTTPLADPTKGSEPPSELDGPSLAMQFVGSRVAFGTQYGGLPLEDLYVLKGTDSGTNVSIVRHSIIDSQPLLAGAQPG